jgi:hypothetical protein
MKNTEKDFDDAAQWAERDMNLPKNSTTARRGEDAAAYGQSVLERALGGRPSIDPQAAPGQHSKVRQVRLPQAINEQLDAVARQQHRRTSDIMREALAEYLATHAAN